MSDSLAIVIPAYKPDYLTHTLDSFVSQSCGDFVVYVGDDNSPYDIKSIVDAYSNKLNIHYCRFDDNLGQTDLVAHWNRCLDLIGDEDWVWLFSDDDIAEPDCVKDFMNAQIPADVNVIHFNLKTIDDHSEVMSVGPLFPTILSSEQFFNLLYRKQIKARMPEFVFRASAIKRDGFEKFDLAWRSDNATVMKYAFPKGVLTLSGENSFVRWRQGSNNISSQGLEMSRKNGATLSFFNWVTSFFAEKGIHNPMSRFRFIKTYVFLLEYRGLMKFLTDCKKSARQLKFVRWFEYPVFSLLAIYRLIYRNFER